MREEVCTQAPDSGSLWGGLERNGVVGPAPRRRGSNFRGERRTNSLFLQAKGAHNCQRCDKMEIPDYLSYSHRVVRCGWRLPPTIAKPCEKEKK